MKMEPQKLREVLEKAGLKHGLPKTQEGQVEYLCASEENARCDPYNETWCEDGLTCDVANKVCLTEDQVKHQSTNNRISTWNYKGRKIIGTKSSISALQEALKKSKEKVIEEKSGVSGDEYAEKKILAKKLKKLNVGSSKKELMKKSLEDLRHLLIKHEEQEIEEKAEEEVGEEEAEEEEKVGEEEEVGEEEAGEEEAEEDIEEKKILAKKLKKLGVGKSKKEFMKKSLADLRLLLAKHSSEDSDRPEEGSEVIDIEQALANIMTGKGKHINELAKIQKSVLRCLGLLS